MNNTSNSVRRAIKDVSVCRPQNKNFRLLAFGRAGGGSSGFAPGARCSARCAHISSLSSSKEVQVR